jgi:hypothetical protein
VVSRGSHARLREQLTNKSCERREIARGRVLSQAGAPLTWTRERADMLFVCERLRKAADTERQPQRAERAMSQGASRHAFRLRATEEGSGYRAPASASGASNVTGSERRRLSSASDDEVGGSHARLREQLTIKER